MLSYPKMSIKKISEFTGLDRTTVQRELNGQIEFKRVFKGVNPENRKENLYGIKKIVRALLEKILMERLETRGLPNT